MEFLISGAGAPIWEMLDEEGLCEGDRNQTRAARDRHRAGDIRSCSGLIHDQSPSQELSRQHPDRPSLQTGAGSTLRTVKFATTTPDG